ncbi:MAG: D-alanine--D-alanine ligase [Gammaproteobacteria bacterium]|nr:MAG: D-alanine--D-alanine ligase [Gammaproteobacteria bacterium]
MTIHHAADFGRVAVLMGGRSAEREISLKSGQAVLDGLISLGVDAHKIDVDRYVAQQLEQGDFARAFIILHGRGGEDGEIQGLLNTLEIPFTGSDITGAVLSMNKLLSKQVWIQHGLPTAEFATVTSATDANALVQSLSLPLIIKPVNEGSSIGMSKVQSVDELAAAITLATEFDAEVIAERWIEGEEYTVAIVNGKALPTIQLKTPNEFYDFEAKYQSNTTQYLCPCGLSEQIESQLQALAVNAFNVLRMKGWGRIDFMRDQAGEFYLLEANSIPGMTDHSLVPMAAKQAGLDFNQLVWQILAGSMVEVNNG